MLDRAALNELFDYTTFTWEVYGNAVRALPDGSIARAVDGSEWPALRNVLFHLATAWDGWLIERLGIEHPARREVRRRRSMGGRAGAPRADARMVAPGDR